MPPTNTYTLTFSDAHSHSIQIAGMPADASTSVAGKVQALQNTLASLLCQNALSSLTQTDTLTVTITQP